LKGAETKDVVADVVEQILLLRNRHHDVLDRDDLVDDVADFLARRINIEPGQLRQVDRLDQCTENGGLGLVVGFRSPRIDGGRGRIGTRGRARQASPGSADARGAVGGDTIGAPRPSDGNGVRPVSTGAVGAAFGASADGSGAGAGATAAGGPTTRPS